MRIIVFWGLYWGPPSLGKLPYGWLSKLWSLFGYPKNRDDRDYIGVLWGIMEKKMETTLLGLYIPYESPFFGYPKY